MVVVVVVVVAVGEKLHSCSMSSKIAKVNLHWADVTHALMAALKVTLSKQLSHCDMNY